MKSQLEKLLRALYLKLWNDWFPSGLAPAQIVIEFPDQALISRGGDVSAYSHTENKIVIRVLPGDIHLTEIDEMGQWAHWRADLIHEMLHEYQHKVLTSASPQGIALKNKKLKSWQGPGHDEIFYSAIEEKAHYFDEKPEEFILKL